MKQHPPALLLVDASSARAEPIERLADSLGYAVEYREALDDSATTGPPPAIALLCIDAGEDELAQQLEAGHLDEVGDVIFYGPRRPGPRLSRWLRQNAAFFLSEPLDEDYLGALLADVWKEQSRNGRAAEEPQLELDQFGMLRGNCRAMRRIYRMLRKLAPQDLPLLVWGESGTGKELVARTVHASSLRSAGPFLAINCSAIAGELVESELFGHEKGSFSGAERRHLGVFERADGGTLLLDEITEMPIDAQAKLLRVLEQGAFRRVGGERDIACSVRIVAATNRDPLAAVESGRLRQDLLYRISRFTLTLPPLRERGEDIVQLARHFVAEFNAAQGKRVQLTPEAEQALLGYGWPGNVRELRSVLESAHLVAQNFIDLADLPRLDDATASEGDYLRIGVGTSIEDAERRLIFATLERMEGNKSATAEVLGISLKTLYNRLNAYAKDDQASSAGDSPPASDTT